MAFSKVVLNNSTLIDLTQDTVVADKLYQNYTAHGADGVAITGTATGGGGSGGYVTQDANGRIILSDTNGGYGYGVLSSPSPVGLYAAYPPTKQLLYSWDLTQSLTDTVSGAVITLSGATQDSNGLTLASVSDYATMPFYYRPYYTYEFDISAMNKVFTSKHGRFILTNGNDRGFMYRSSGKWSAYLNGAWATDQGTYTSLAGKTLTLVVENDKPRIYLDGTLWYSINLAENLSNTAQMKLGSSGGQTFYDVTITGIRVYWGIDSQFRENS